MAGQLGYWPASRGQRRRGWVLEATPLLSPSLGKGRHSAARPAAFPGSELVMVAIEKNQAGPLVLEDGERHGAVGHASFDSLLL